MTGMNVNKLRSPYDIIRIDPWLEPYSGEIDLRMARFLAARKRIAGRKQTLSSFADGYLYFGIHRTKTGWAVREWLPGADEVYLTGDFNSWNRTSHPLKKLDGGVWEICLDGRDALRHGQYIKLYVRRGENGFERLPAYSTRVSQDETTHRFCTQVWAPEPFHWTDGDRLSRTAPAPVIYEAHVGMAQEREGIGTYREFADQVLERIAGLGYNTVQLMAIQEHPYYGSFGYQVTNFFAASSWYGEPEDLKYLINKAHGMGLRVLLDVVHSHACPNPGEGLECQDGTDDQYFLTGDRGRHPAWGTRLFNYGKTEVLHFLLSNLKFWLEEYHFDGFRFDGVTSMLYHDHGLGTAFMDYGQYFTMNTDLDAMAYLMLANEVIHETDPNATTVAEEMSGMPGMCLPVEQGGVGFDYRLSMGEPDHWIKLLKDTRDEDWQMHGLWYEMTTRRPMEKRIAYCESHDQALVGDKTLIFRMADAEMYTGMDRIYHSLTMDRAIELHKMIRFMTLSCGGDGYLNFMGNEFGHPEWIDFPREGNGWSYKYARRQWHLVDNGYLKFGLLNDFDRAMLEVAEKYRLLEDPAPVSLWIDQERKIISFSRAGLLFLFNFHGTYSERSFFMHTHTTGEGRYRVILSTDEKRFGGNGLTDHDYVYETGSDREHGNGFMIYSPCRAAMVLARVDDRKENR